MEGNDQIFMKMALELAKKANPSPNPRVGSVIVKNGRIIGQGYHEAAGEDHAEIVALKSVKDRKLVPGSTMYVTLEPCSHYDKRTPPCAKTIMDAGIKEIVIGCLDENPKVRGVEELREKIKVKVLNDSECRKLNEAFFHWIKTGRPFIFLKFATTLDGRIATKTGHSRYISSPQSRSLSYSWRDLYDSILVGINTVLIDDPRLTSRTGKKRNPIRIIVDSHLRIPLNAICLAPSARRIVVAGNEYDKGKRKKLESLGVEVITFPGKDLEHVDMNALFEYLGKQEITSVLVEGGSEIATTLLEENLINKAAFFVAAKILGAGKSAFEGKGVERMHDAWQLKNISIKLIGEDVLVEGYF